MQRLLTLLLLTGSACYAQEMQGPGGGSYFYVRGEEQGELQGIRVFVGLLGLIKGVQLQFGGHWSARYGAPGGHAHEFLLQAGERVTAVEGSARACIRYLRWTTSRGRQAAFGSPGGRPFSSRAPVPGQQLLTTNGQHRLLCLSGIGFKWGFVQGAPTSASTVASTLSPTTAPRPEISPVSTLLPTTAPSSAPTLTSTLPSMVALSPEPIPVPTLASMVAPGPAPIPTPTLPSTVAPNPISPMAPPCQSSHPIFQLCAQPSVYSEDMQPRPRACSEPLLQEPCPPTLGLAPADLDEQMPWARGSDPYAE